jgi:hypothetical protein
MGYAADQNVDEPAQDEVIAMKYCVDVASKLEPMWLEQSQVVSSQSTLSISTAVTTFLTSV